MNEQSEISLFEATMYCCFSSYVYFAETTYNKQQQYYYQSLSRKKISEIYIRFITWTLYEIVFSISPIQIFRASERMYKNTSSIFSLLIRLLASWFCKGARIFFTNDLCQPTKHIIFSLKVSQLHMQYLTSSSVIKKNGFFSPPVLVCIPQISKELSFDLKGKKLSVSCQ